MNQQRWQQISELYAAALARPEGDRAPFLTEACGHDESLRREVESLLAVAQLSNDLSRVAGAPEDDALTRTVAPGDSGRASRDADLVGPGRRFGPYLIVRLLGRGGMGEVYEAEHLENGRLLALKLLIQPLRSEADRARFLREGRLAASITDEHIIYIYGTEEINGVPAIAMELATGGSLRDRVESGGPLEPRAAVDAILEVAAGLEAAAGAGVLHRDVKPSNCFVDADGSVKVGDFGLSIPTGAHAETQLTAKGTLLATPAFASPEQLRGDALDVRSDLYSTGATLYYLLTGKPPFEGEGLVKLVANVLGREVRSPEELRPVVPIGLAEIVVRCLAKDPGRRPVSYEELRRQLLPFSSQAPVIAPLGSRVLAFIVDLILVELPFAVLLDPGTPLTMHDMWSPPRIAANVGLLLYFGLVEGIGGASLGKRLFGLRIVRAGHRAPGIGWSFVRAFFFLQLPSLLAVPLMVLVVFPSSSFIVVTGVVLTQRTAAELIGLAANLVSVLILFSTARRANGFAALHDLATRTRVVRAFESAAREPLEMPAREIPPREAERIGPYTVVGATDASRVDSPLVAYDPMLRRFVWIRRLPPGSPVAPPARRDMTRPGRLRWLNGKRTSTECWDAYEAPDGRAFLSVSRRRSPWAAVRFWLWDLALELESLIEANDQAATVGFGYIWITKRGRAMLLDFPAPGAPLAAAADRLATPLTAVRCRAFLSRLAAVALNGESEEARPPIRNDERLPLHAHTFLKQLGQGFFRDLPSLSAALRELLGKRTTLTPGQRALHIALSVSVPAAALVAALVAAVITQRWSVGGIVAPFAGALALVSSLAIASAAYFRGGLLLRSLGIALADGHGDDAPRVLAFVRAVVAWSPCVCFVLALGFDSPLWAGASILLAVTGAAVAILNPQRGLQDRLAGTWLVPR